VLLQAENHAENQAGSTADLSPGIREGAFSWRARGAAPATLDQFESKARKWVATDLRLGEIQGEPFNQLKNRTWFLPHEPQR
jgi:hypothetical protein